MILLVSKFNKNSDIIQNSLKDLFVCTVFKCSLSHSLPPGFYLLYSTKTALKRVTTDLHICKFKDPFAVLSLFDLRAFVPAVALIQPTTLSSKHRLHLASRASLLGCLLTQSFPCLLIVSLHN